MICSFVHVNHFYAVWFMFKNNVKFGGISNVLFGLYSCIPALRCLVYVNQECAVWFLFICNMLLGSCLPVMCCLVYVHGYQLRAFGSYLPVMWTAAVLFGACL